MEGDTIMEGDVVEELRVTFDPPLYLERRAWVMSMLRREGITQVRRSGGWL